MQYKPIKHLNAIPIILFEAKQINIGYHVTVKRCNGFLAGTRINY